MVNVRYEIENNKNKMVVMNIYFNKNKFNQFEITVTQLTEQKEVKASLDFMWRLLRVKI